MTSQPSSDREVLDGTVEEISLTTREQRFDGDQLSELPTYQLRRDDTEDGKSPRVFKQKVKKVRQKALSIEFEYAGKPTGASSSSVYVGMDDFVDPEEPPIGNASSPDPPPVSPLQRSGERIPENWDEDEIDTEVSDGNDHQSQAMVKMQGLAKKFWEEYVQGDQLENGVQHEEGAIYYEAPSPSPDQYPQWSADDGLKYGETEVENVHGEIQDNSFEEQFDNNDGDNEKENDDDEMATEKTLAEYESEVQFLKAQLLDVRKASESHKKVQQRQIEQLKSERDEIDDALKKVRSSLHVEQHKFAKEKKKFIDEFEEGKEKIRNMRLDLDAKADAINDLICEKERLEAEKSKLEAIIEEARNRPCNCNVDITGHKQRAVGAESSLLRLKKQVELRTLEKAYRDAKGIVTHLTTIIEKASSESKPGLVAYQKEWQSNMQTLKENSQIVEKLFDMQIRQVESGTALSTMKPIVVPPPPLAPKPPAKPTVNPTMIKSPASSEYHSVPTSPENGTGKADCRNVQNSIINGSGKSAFTFVQPTVPNLSTASTAQISMRPIPLPLQPQVPSTAQISMGPGRLPLQPQIPSTAQSLMGPGRLPLQPPQVPSTAQISMAPNRLPLQPQVQVPSQPLQQIPLPTSAQISQPPSNLPFVLPPSLQKAMQPPPGFARGSNFEPALPNVAPTGADDGGERRLKKLDGLIDAIINKIPYISRENALKSVEEYRDLTPGKTLRGIKFPDLVNAICTYAVKAYPPKTEQVAAPVMNPTAVIRSSSGGNIAMAAGVAEMPPFQQFPSTFGFNKLPSTYAKPPPSLPFRLPVISDTSIYRPQASTRVEEECFVCLEKLSAKPTLTMECSHVAHESCLRQWLTKEQTCPLCRKHALLPDEYPSL